MSPNPTSNITTAREKTVHPTTPDIYAPTPNGFSPIYRRDDEKDEVDVRQLLVNSAIDGLIAFLLVFIAVAKFLFDTVIHAYDLITDEIADSLRPAVKMIKAVWGFYKKHPVEFKEMVTSAWRIAVNSYKTELWTFTEAFRYLWAQTVTKTVTASEKHTLKKTK